MFGKFQSFIKSRLLATRPESVYFYTLHRCASSFFSDFVLKNVRHLRLMDYADRMYNGDPVECVTFKERGFIYGPIRVSTGPESIMYTQFIEPVSRSEFVRDKIALFLVRDPRDIVVSSYYSFGYTHEFSNVREIEQQQRELRENIRRTTIDAYAVDCARFFVRPFQTIDTLTQACTRGILLKYEDMIYDWEKFSSGLSKYLDIGPKRLRQIYTLSRPLENERDTGHRRSGKPGAYKQKLSVSTVEELNSILAPVLTRFRYEPW